MTETKIVKGSREEEDLIERVGCKVLAVLESDIVRGDGWMRFSVATRALTAAQCDVIRRTVSSNGFTLKGMEELMAVRDATTKWCDDALRRMLANGTLPGREAPH